MQWEGPHRVSDWCDDTAVAGAGTGNEGAGLKSTWCLSTPQCPGLRWTVSCASLELLWLRAVHWEVLFACGRSAD